MDANRAALKGKGANLGVAAGQFTGIDPGKPSDGIELNVVTSGIGEKHIKRKQNEAWDA